MEHETHVLHVLLHVSSYLQGSRVLHGCHCLGFGRLVCLCLLGKEMKLCCAMSSALVQRGEL